MNQLQSPSYSPRPDPATRISSRPAIWSVGIALLLLLADFVLLPTNHATAAGRCSVPKSYGTFKGVGPSGRGGGVLFFEDPQGTVYLVPLYDDHQNCSAFTRD